MFHSNGLHVADVRYCDCGHVPDGCRRHTQLLRAGLFPASIDRPRTAFSFEVLNLFDKLTLQGKTTLFDFHRALVQMTDNIGGLTGAVSY